MDPESETNFEYDSDTETEIVNEYNITLSLNQLDAIKELFESHKWYLNIAENVWIIKMEKMIQTLMQ